MKPNPQFADAGINVFEVMTKLARECGAINLGQGFPETPGPAELRRAAADAAVNGWNPYAPSRGIEPLRAAIRLGRARRDLIRG